MQSHTGVIGTDLSNDVDRYYQILQVRLGIRNETIRIIWTLIFCVSLSYIHRIVSD